MKIVVASLLALLSTVTGSVGTVERKTTGSEVPPPACRDCTTILAWKLYYPGVVPDWPVREPNTTTPGFFKRLVNNKCYPQKLFTSFNIMMFTNPTIKPGNKCCGDEDDVENDYIDLCGNITLTRIDPDEKQIFPTKGTVRTELFWPWFLYGDDECEPPKVYSDNEADFVPADNCNPSKNIYNASFLDSFEDYPLPEGEYRLSGATWNGCPARDSNQNKAATGPQLDTDSIVFKIKKKC